MDPCAVAAAWIVFRILVSRHAVAIVAPAVLRSFARAM